MPLELLQLRDETEQVFALTPGGGGDLFSGEKAITSLILKNALSGPCLGLFPLGWHWFDAAI